MKKLKPQVLNLLLLIVVISLIGFGLNSCLSTSKGSTGSQQPGEKMSKDEAYLASVDNMVVLFGEEELTEKKTEVPRGTVVEVKKTIKKESGNIVKVKYNSETFYLSESHIAKEHVNVIKTDVVYVKYFTNLYQNNYEIAALLEEGSNLTVKDFEMDLGGNVTKYIVDYNGVEGYVLPLYVTTTESDISNKIILDHVPEKYMNFNATPRPKPNYESNPYRDDVKALYFSYYTLTKKSFDLQAEIDDYVKNGPINAIVFDIKHDQGFVSFKSDTVSKYATEADKYAISKEKLSEIVKIAKDNDIYLIARIVTFRDNFFAEKHPEAAITIKETGEYYKYDDSIFVSAHNRLIWDYNLSIAEEAADLGFNEIQFDYVRFSENVTPEKHDLHKPITDESRTQSIQRYLEYAKDRLTHKEVYLAADVYGLTSYLDHESVKIGQFFEAISSTVDVICPMAYPSHYDAYFSKSEPSVKIGWPNTYAEYETLIKYYVQDLKIRNAKLEHPAYLRVWIEGYSSAIGTDEKMPAQVAGLKYNDVDSYLYWGNGRVYNTSAMNKAENQ